MLYALRGLDRCWLQEAGRWSHKYHLDGRQAPNESVPESDVYYTLNVLLGLSRLAGSPGLAWSGLRDVFERNAPLIVTLPVPKYAYGMALWASAELGWALPPSVLTHIRTYLGERENWLGFHAQDLGLILTGVCAQARFAPGEWSGMAHDLFLFLTERFTTRSGLFFDAARGLRRRFASFATNTYLTIGCYAYGAQFNRGAAIELAHACTRKLIALQGPQGEWPWFFDAPSGRVVDFYEVYAVHQDGMAPAMLELAETAGFGAEATAALTKGFMWIYGNNQLGRSMLVPELGLIFRSHVRSGELSNKGHRVARAIANAALGRSAALIDPSDVVVRRECRSYHLGWVIWSFAKRRDLPEVTHHRLLAA
jgi:hypothetical protein